MQKAAWVTPLARVSREAFIPMLRNEAVQSAKMVGLALLMYAQDNDEILPPDGSVENAIMPFLQDAGALEGFTYLGNGAPLASIDRPAETIIGSTGGPGGAALIYADGHVKWKNQ